MKIDKQTDIGLLLTTFDISNRSTGKKRKVGALIWDADKILTLCEGWNKMPDQLGITECENIYVEPYECVIHAEEDAVIKFFKLEKYLYSTKFLVMAATYSPCMNCCKLMVHAGIKRFIYSIEHEKNFVTQEIENGFSPKEFLLACGIEVIKYNYEELFPKHKLEDAMIFGKKKFNKTIIFEENDKK